MNILLNSKRPFFSPMLSLLMIPRMFYSKPLNIQSKRPLQIPFKKWKIVKGDTVKIISGVDKGKVSKVVKILRKTNQIVVKGVNLKLTHTRSQDQGPPIEKKVPSPIHVSNAGLYDSQVKRAVRVRFGYNAQTGQKLRISKATGRILKKPVTVPTRQERGKNRKAGKKDTIPDLVHHVTYQGEDFQAIKDQFDKFIQEKERKERFLVFAQ